MMKTQECPYCYSVIDFRATVCPVCRRDIAAVGITSQRSSGQKKKKRGCLWQWRFTPVVIVALLVACGFSSLIMRTRRNNVPVTTPSRSLPATFTPVSNSNPRNISPAGISVENTLEAEIKAALKSYGYEQQQILVEDLEINGKELVVYLRRRGTPSYSDYFGQLGIIHGIVAANQPNVVRVKTYELKLKMAS